jgi:mannan endo-1,4-beta-mannosidase
MTARRRRSVRTATTAAVTVFAVSCLSACGFTSSIANKAAQQASSPQAATQVQFRAGKTMIGYRAPGFPLAMTQFQQLERQTGVRADIAAWFVAMPSAFDPREARQVSIQGVLPLLELDSGAIPVAQIADGRWDTYFSAYARAVAAYSSPVAIDFDHDFNESWTQWGYRHTSAAVFVAAWRRIVKIFSANSAANVIWVWNPGVSGPNTTPIPSWYPGDQYVTWVGLDGYLSDPVETFQSVFGGTLRQIGTFTAKNVLITDTSANPGPSRVSQINSLFAGVAATPQVIGLIWSAEDQQANRDGRLQGDGPALAAFRADWLRDKAR